MEFFVGLILILAFVVLGLGGIIYMHWETIIVILCILLCILLLIAVIKLIADYFF